LKNTGYQDINSEYYSPEIDLAIQLHHAIRIEKFGNVNHRRESRLSKWLIENKPVFDHTKANRISRLSTIIDIIKSNRVILYFTDQLSQ
jgi:hypothetical protein